MCIRDRYDNAGYTGTAYTKIGAAEYGDKTCYGYFKDVQKPELAAAVKSDVSPNTKGWYSTDQDVYKRQVYIV